MSLSSASTASFDPWWSGQHEAAPLVLSAIGQHVLKVNNTDFAALTEEAPAFSGVVDEVLVTEGGFQFRRDRVCRRGRSSLVGNDRRGRAGTGGEEEEKCSTGTCRVEWEHSGIVIARPC
ncbi:hypothetical protein J1614_011694 [Plenodomus biglobosus]|nr:hypothetical protein J1614_011694 [Plenodomus biglobosus]